MSVPTIIKIVDGTVRGSSRPIIAETTHGTSFVKLRGAAQGCGALIAEIIVSEIAKSLSLNVLPVHFVLLCPNTPTADNDEELGDLLKASYGFNLAFPYLNSAREPNNEELNNLTCGEKAAILWLDKFVMNPDRNSMNMNLLLHDDKIYAIDHGASLGFQYNWSTVTEASPIVNSYEYMPHIFEHIQWSKEWKYWENMFSEMVTREVLQRAIELVPNDFIESLNTEIMASTNSQQEIRRLVCRRKEAYLAFLWKRLKSLRNFSINQLYN